MSNQKLLLPSVDAKNHVDTDTGEILPAAYRTGIPRNYRFNASTGALNLNGESNITKKGASFKLLPIALRIFKDNLFEWGRKLWAEVFFLNSKNQVCSVMFHGYSVENLTSLESEMFYEDLKIGDVVLTVSPKEKTSKKIDENGKNPKYYICDFTFEAAEAELVQVQKAATEDKLIYRRDTWNVDCDIEMTYNIDTGQLNDILALPTVDAEPQNVEA